MTLEPWVTLHDGVLGTLLETRVVASDDDAREVDAAILAEIGRLDLVFSTYRPDSELRRWRAGRLDAVSAELGVVLAEALAWSELSGGAFHPATEGLRRRWLDAEASGVLPEPVAAGPVPYGVDGDRVHRLGDCSGVDLNAIAKGFIVDAALAAGAAAGTAAAIVVNIGGDLRHWGAGDVRVGIENPATPWDNARPLTRIRVANGALATSGSARRGFRVGGRWFGHVLDPRTGWPVEQNPSVSVVALDAMTADAAATVLGVGGLQLAERLGPEVDYLLVEADGTQHRSPGWAALEY